MADDIALLLAANDLRGFIARRAEKGACLGLNRLGFSGTRRRGRNGERRDLLGGSKGRRPTQG